MGRLIDTTVQSENLVSVVIATYRSGGSLRYALESVKQQSYQNFEVIVVADGDPEDSQTIVDDYDQRFRYIRLPHNHGSQAIPNQAGIDAARGEWIAYLGHDDLWMPRHLEQLRSVASGTRAEFVYSLVCNLHPDGSVDVTGPPDTCRTRSIDGWFVQPSGWMHRRAVAARTGGWRMPGPWPVDVDFLQRARRCGVEFAFTGNVGVLKFLSWDYGSYAPDALKPQPPYLSRLRDNPDALERDILLAAAKTFAQRRQGARDNLSTTVRSFIWSLIEALKHQSHEWPLVRSLWAKGYKRRLRRARKHRGLDK